MTTNTLPTIIFLDFESSGLSTYAGAEPIELAAIALDSRLTELSRFGPVDIGVQIPENISPKALEVNGFTLERIAAGREPGSVFREFGDWLRQYAPVTLAAHNLRFDREFLDWSFRRYLPKDATKGLFARHEICTCNLYFLLTHVVSQTPGSCSLDAACAEYGIERVSHTAMGDCQAGVEVLRRLTADIREGLYYAELVASPRVQPLSPEEKADPPPILARDMRFSHCHDFQPPGTAINTEGATTPAVHVRDMHAGQEDRGPQWPAAEQAELEVDELTELHSQLLMAEKALANPCPGPLWDRQERLLRKSAATLRARIAELEELEELRLNFRARMAEGEQADDGLEPLRWEHNRVLKFLETCGGKLPPDENSYFTGLESRMRARIAELERGGDVEGGLL